jgi:hypothetical protein
MAGARSYRIEIQKGCCIKYSTLSAVARSPLNSKSQREPLRLHDNEPLSGTSDLYYTASYFPGSQGRTRRMFTATVTPDARGDITIKQDLGYVPPYASAGIDAADGKYVIVRPQCGDNQNKCMSSGLSHIFSGSGASLGRDGPIGVREVRWSRLPAPTVLIGCWSSSDLLDHATPSVYCCCAAGMRATCERRPHAASCPALSRPLATWSRQIDHRCTSAPVWSVEQYSTTTRCPYSAERG